MLRAAIVLGLVGCVALDPHEPLLEVTSHVGLIAMPLTAASRYDLLFVIDRSVFMTPYRARLLDNVRVWIGKFETTPGGLPGLHIGLAGEPHYLVDDRRPDGSRVRNYAGNLVDRVRELLDVGASGEPPSTPLEDMESALIQPPPGFHRDGVYLEVVIVSARDDASPQSVEHYGDVVDAIAPNGFAIANVIAPVPAPRLQAWLERFSSRQAYVSIDNALYYDTVIPISDWLTHINNPCWTRPLHQPLDCSAEFDGSSIARCRGVETDLCWDIATDAYNCPSGDHEKVALNWRYPPRGGYFQMQCVVE